MLFKVNQEYNLPHLTSVDLQNQNSQQNDPFIWSKDDPSMMIYTSGTTGRPKGAEYMFFILVLSITQGQLNELNELE